MGMAASQVNFLGLTGRKADIIRQQQRLSNEKMALTRDMRKISQDYQAGLNQKVLKWSNNSGASYVDLSYKNLMSPSTLNLNKAYLLTDMNEKVVVDSKYKKYAEMISPDGKASGNWSGDTKYGILAELTGISSEKIKTKEELDIKAEEAYEAYLLACQKEPKISSKTSIKGLLEKAGTYPLDNSETWHEKYSHNDVVFFGLNQENAINNLDKVVEDLKNDLSPYFVDNADLFEKACDNIKDEYTNLISGDSINENSGGFLSKKNALPPSYQFDIRSFIDTIIGAYIALGGEATTPEIGYPNDQQVIWYDIDSDKYEEEKKEHDAWLANRNYTKEEYNNAVNTCATYFSAEEENLIKFYDEIFSTIAEKGWVFNDSINDTDYLNQMLQNNLYTITTVDRERFYDIDNKKLEYENKYVTRIADNFEKIFQVNDSDAREEALTEYEYKKSIINQKETRIDLRMQDLSTELSAINQMMQGIETVKKDNIERTFGIFG